MGVDRRILYPLRRCSVDGASRFSGEIADPILHDILVKDIFAWVYLVSTEQITNRVSLQIIEIGYNSSVMDRD